MTENLTKTEIIPVQLESERHPEKTWTFLLERIVPIPARLSKKCIACPRPPEYHLSGPYTLQEKGEGLAV